MLVTLVVVGGRSSCSRSSRSSLCTALHSDLHQASTCRLSEPVREPSCVSSGIAAMSCTETWQMATSFFAVTRLGRALCARPGLFHCFLGMGVFFLFFFVEGSPWDGDKGKPKANRCALGSQQKVPHQAVVGKERCMESFRRSATSGLQRRTRCRPGGFGGGACLLLKTGAVIVFWFPCSAIQKRSLSKETPRKGKNRPVCGRLRGLLLGSL